MLINLSCHQIRHSHCCLSSSYCGSVLSRACGSMRVLLCVKWNPDGDVEVVSGQLFILLIHSVVVMLLGIASNSVLFHMWHSSARCGFLVIKFTFQYQVSCMGGCASLDQFRKNGGGGGGGGGGVGNVLWAWPKCFN